MTPYIEIIEAEIKFDRKETEIVLFGVIPEDYSGLTSDLDIDDQIFYWLTKNEAHSFVAGFTNGDWIVVEVCDQFRHH